jgi:hypothetical protein
MGLAVGERVLAMPMAGAFAEYSIAPANRVPRPDERFSERLRCRSCIKRLTLR